MSAWDELRELAGGVATIDHDGACPYAMTHEDGWSRRHLLGCAVRRLNALCALTQQETPEPPKGRTSE